MTVNFNSGIILEYGYNQFLYNDKWDLYVASYTSLRCANFHVLFTARVGVLYQI